MDRSCARALEIGLPAIAFTEHADFVTVHKDQHCVEIDGYLAAIEHCRTKFKDLRILTGVELGEPHWFPKETAAVLAAAELDRVLGSVHCVRLGSEIVDASQFRFKPASEVPAATREYFVEVLAMVESPQPFEVLAHLDYPKRYWPEGMTPYREEDFEAELRLLLTAAVKRGCILEVNTTRGEEGERKLCPGLTTLKWWYELGGEAVTLGSDAHDPDKIAAGFELATQVIEAAGFKPSPEPTALWRR
jgi:histidinol-phosphatase (PHP family)